MKYPDEAALALTQFAPPHHRAELLSENLGAMALSSDYEAYRERVERTATNRNDPVFVASFMNLARMSENLDACRLCALGGRVPAANAVLRMLYESFLNLILIGFHQGVIPKKSLHRTLRDIQGAGQITREEIAERFVAFGHWKMVHYLDDIYERSSQEGNAPLVSLIDGEEEAVGALRRRADDAEQRFLFNPKYTHYWHPFGGTRDVYNFLWPSEGAPIFPAADMEITPRLWSGAFFKAFQAASQEVHGSALSLLAEEGSRKGMVETISHGRRYNSTTLPIARMLFIWALSGCSIITETRSEWSAAKTFDKITGGFELPN